MSVFYERIDISIPISLTFPSSKKKYKIIPDHYKIQHA